MANIYKIKSKLTTEQDDFIKSQMSDTLKAELLSFLANALYCSPNDANFSYYVLNSYELDKLMSILNEIYSIEAVVKAGYTIKNAFFIKDITEDAIDGKLACQNVKIDISPNSLNGDLWVDNLLLEKIVNPYLLKYVSKDRILDKILGLGVESLSEVDKQILAK